MKTSIIISMSNLFVDTSTNIEKPYLYAVQSYGSSLSNNTTAQDYAKGGSQPCTTITICVSWVKMTADKQAAHSAWLTSFQQRGNEGDVVAPPLTLNDTFLHKPHPMRFKRYMGG